MPLNINEFFGPTLQGEGPSTGQQAIFLRLTDCPLSCIGCDTPYTWAFTEERAKRHVTQRAYDRKGELKVFDVKQVVDMFLRMDPFSNAKLLVITGGEPLLQQAELAAEFIPEFAWKTVMSPTRIEVETAGIFSPARLVAAAREHSIGLTFNVSPKLGSSGNTLKARYRAGVIEEFADLAIQGQAIFKFVIGWTGEQSVQQDLADMRLMLKLHRIPPHAVWLMPCGITSGDIVANARGIVDVALSEGFNLSTRLHVLLWENTRGT